VPAAAVIPAPIAYAKVVAVKKLVVGRRAVGGEEVAGLKCPLPPYPWQPHFVAAWQCL
jgi:hypothetical protein